MNNIVSNIKLMMNMHMKAAMHAASEEEVAS